MPGQAPTQLEARSGTQALQGLPDRKEGRKDVVSEQVTGERIQRQLPGSEGPGRKHAEAKHRGAPPHPPDTLGHSAPSHPNGSARTHALAHAHAHTHADYHLQHNIHQHQVPSPNPIPEHSHTGSHMPGLTPHPLHPSWSHTLPATEESRQGPPRPWTHSEMCRKMSGPPSAGVMKPWPLERQKHLHTPL